MVSLRVACATAIVLVALFQLGSSKKCYECTTSADCDKEMKDEQLKDCTGDFPKCIRVTGRDGKVYQRGCSNDDGCNLFYDCKICNEDKCNSSPAVLPSFLVICVVSAVIVKYFY